MSEMIVNKLTGKTSAGSIDIVSENSGSTMNLNRSSSKVWVNWNGSGTVAIRDSINTASISDIGVGDYRVNFIDAFVASDDPCVLQGCTNAVSNAGNGFTAYVLSTTQCFAKPYENGGVADKTIICIGIFGELT